MAPCFAGIVPAAHRFCYNRHQDPDSLRIRSAIQIEAMPMLEFKSVPQKRFRPVPLAIALGVLAILLGGTAIYVHYQKGVRSRSGNSLVEVPGLLRAGNTNFEYYKTRIHFENLKAGLSISLSHIRTATISGTIVNDGDRTLEALELHVTLYDAWGKISKERTDFAFRPGKYSYKPLLPLERRAFSISIEGVEYYWDPQKISAPEITGLKYQ
jgi:hypothetical protein